MKRNSPNSYLTDVSIDDHDISVLVIVTDKYNFDERDCEVQEIDNKSVLDYYQATSFAEYQALCKKARREAVIKYKAFDKETNE